MISRHLNNSCCIFAWLFCAVASVSAQTPVTVDANQAQSHPTRRIEPVYPAIAKAAQVQGDVSISIVIDVAGQVTSEKVVSGPPMLRGAALEAVKQLHFTPFQLNGQPTQAATTVTVPFHLEQPGDGPNPEQQKAAQAWFPLSDQCRSALKAGETQKALDYCQQALAMAREAGELTSSDQLAMIESHQGYGHALLDAGNAKDAVAEENAAVDAARAYLKDTDQEYAMPFYWRAIAEAKLGNGDAGSADFTIAEETHRRAIAHLPSMKKMYGQYLAAILKQHATLLDQMGKTAEAAKLRMEASSLP